MNQSVLGHRESVAGSGAGGYGLPAISLRFLAAALRRPPVIMTQGNLRSSLRVVCARVGVADAIFSRLMEMPGVCLMGGNVLNLERICRIAGITREEVGRGDFRGHVAKVVPVVVLPPPELLDDPSLPRMRCNRLFSATTSWTR